MDLQALFSLLIVGGMALYCLIASRAVRRSVRPTLAPPIRIRTMRDVTGQGRSGQTAQDNALDGIPDNDNVMLDRIAVAGAIVPLTVEMIAARDFALEALSCGLILAPSSALEGSRLDIERALSMLQLNELMSDAHSSPAVVLQAPLQ